MAVDISSYLFRKVLRISAFDISTNELIGSITHFNNVTFSNGQQETEVLSSGTPIAVIDYGKTATFSASSPLVSDTILSMQSGTKAEMVENTTDIAIPDTFTVTADTGITKYGGTGAAGTEIRFAYLLDSAGSPTKTFTQATVAGPGTFSYASGTRTLTFDTGEVPDGSQILVYTYPTISTAKKITNDSNSFSTAARCLIDIQIADMCDLSKEYLMRVIFENGKFSGSFEWSIDGQTPAEQAFEVKSMLPCGVSKLWDAYVFDDDDIIVA